MSYNGIRLACVMVVAVTLSRMVSSQELPTTTPEPPHPHPHHDANHQHHGHKKLTHHSLVEVADEDLENDVLQRTRRGLKDTVNLLGLAGQLYTEQKEDQAQAFKKVSMLLADSVAPEPSKENTTTSTSTSTAATTTSGSSDESSEAGSDNGSSAGGRSTTEASVTQAPGSSTTAPPYKATASELMGVLRKNILGLRNLFQKEWRTAMEDSEKNTAAAMVEFRNSVRPFLRKNSTSTG